MKIVNGENKVYDDRKETTKNILDRLNNFTSIHKQAHFNKNNNFVDGFYMKDNTICDSLINFFEESSEKKPGVFGSQVANHKVKKSIDLGIYKDNVDIRVKSYMDALSFLIQDYISKYTFLDYQNKWCLFPKFNIQKYDPSGGYFNWHFERDAFDNCFRNVVFMTYLNDVTEGGETEWLYQNMKIKPEKGLTVFWPTDFTHTHRGIVSNTQTKYIATGWYHYSPDVDNQKKIYKNV
jgi:hypothetical protein